MYIITINIEENNIIIEKIKNLDSVATYYLHTKQEIINKLKLFPEMSKTWINCFPHDFKPEV